MTRGQSHTFKVGDRVIPNKKSLRIVDWDYALPYILKVVKIYPQKKRFVGRLVSVYIPKSGLKIGACFNLASPFYTELKRNTCKLSELEKEKVIT